MNSFLYNDFIFSPKYRVWRHVSYWVVHISIWAAFWVVTGAPGSYGRYLFNMALWVPGFILFSYPLVYGAIPHLLLKGKVVQFLTAILTWGVIGIYIDVAYRGYVIIPVQEAMGLDNILPRGPIAFCYLCMTTSAASPMIIKFFKLWSIKQRQWLQEQHQKLAAELQLMKAQVHPHLIFNTLNSIYAFSLEQSSKTTQLILKLSSLLSYILYDCKSEEVDLEKELEAMKNYMDLEKEKYGNNIDISWSVGGEVGNKVLAPLLFLPFFENAMKYSASEGVEKPWVAVDISVKKDKLYCKIANSKDDLALPSQPGLGIANVKRRLDFIYPQNYELKMNDEGDFLVVSLQIQLAEQKKHYGFDLSSVPSMSKENTLVPVR
jgi:two-component system, LytTR family, sensor histidine kinase AlgZ